jgi:hypothetical protein
VGGASYGYFHDKRKSAVRPCALAGLGDAGHFGMLAPVDAATGAEAALALPVAV